MTTAAIRVWTTAYGALTAYYEAKKSETEYLGTYGTEPLWTGHELSALRARAHRMARVCGIGGASHREWLEAIGAWADEDGRPSAVRHDGPRIYTAPAKGRWRLVELVERLLAQ